MSTKTSSTAKLENNGSSSSNNKKSSKKFGTTSSRKKDEDLMQLSSEESCDERDLSILNTALRRMVVIDTLNLIHQCARYSPFGSRSQRLPCEALGVLWLARELIRLGFDLKLFIPDSYMTGVNIGKVSNHFILKELQSLGYLSTIRDHSHDDLILLEYAKTTGGFIVSNDKYRDHAQTFQTRDKASVKIIRERVVRFFFTEVKVDAKWPGGKLALASARANGYLGVDCTLIPPSLKAMYSWDAKEDETHGIVFAQRMMRRQADAVNALQRLDEMCQYIRLQLCDIYGVKPDPLPWFDPSRCQAVEFGRYWNKYLYHVKEEAEREEEEKLRQQRLQQFGGWPH